METIADKSRTKEIIERLQTIMDGASPVPLASGKVMIYKDEVQSLLTELAGQIDMELKTYHEVNDRRGKIINEAKKEAEKIIYQAERSASRMRVNKRTTNVDPVDFSMLSQEELDELDNANEIYGASLIYTDEMLTEVSKLISDTYENMKNDYEIVLQAMQEKIDTLAANRKELMDGLSDMDAKDRSQQILEIGQLLSNELYNARVNGRRNPYMYDDGSIQLTLDLKTEQEIRAEEAEAAAMLALDNARQKELEADEAKANAKEAEEALAKMKEERDKLKEEMSRLKAETANDIEAAKKAEAVKNEEAAKETEAANDKDAVRESQTVKNVEAAKVAEAAKDTETIKENAKGEPASDDDEEYEIIYVTEDELEEGEEYEIEYVDDYDEESEEAADGKGSIYGQKKEEPVKEEPAKEEPVKAEPVKKESVKEVPAKEEPVKEEKTAKADEKAPEQKPKYVQEKFSFDSDEQISVETKLEQKEDAFEGVPMIPHFVKSEKIASVPSEKVAKMASAITTDKRYSGLISRAVAEREKKEEEAAVTVEKAEFEITEF